MPPRKDPTLKMSDAELTAYADGRSSLRPGTRLENTQDKEFIIEVGPCEHCKGKGEKALPRRRDTL